MTRGLLARGARALCLAGLLVGVATPVWGDALASWRWESRVLLVFAPAPRDPALASLDEALAGRECETRDRDLVIGRVIGDQGGEIGGRALTAAEAGRLRDRFRAAEGTLFVLVGKDGGEKYRSAEPPDPEALFGFIDGMPMRRAEMRAGPPPCPSDAGPRKDGA